MATEGGQKDEGTRERRRDGARDAGSGSLCSTTIRLLTDVMTRPDMYRRWYLN
jgi:hypothetical protein